MIAHGYISRKAKTGRQQASLYAIHLFYFTRTAGVAGLSAG
jgi:hypothetical protein